MIGARQGEIRAPDLIEPVLGFRTWHLRGDELYSPYVDVVWPAAPLRAVCLRDRVQFRPGTSHHAEPAPTSACACGIYAYFDPLDRVGSNPHLVRGAVALWGRIEVHRDGMRAQFARAIVLADPPDRRRRREVRRAAERLGIETVDGDELREAALRYARPLPDLLVPDPGWV